MHYPIKEHLEDYLADPARQDLPPEFHAHIGTCRQCRDEVQRMHAQARLLHGLRYSKELEPVAGFYARVMERIEARRGSSIWYAFMEPAFARRVVFASMSLLVLLMAYMIRTEPASSLPPSSPEVVMAVAPPAQQRVGVNPQQDREAVLLTLATYRK